MWKKIGGASGLKMKHNERISPEAQIVYPDHFLFSTIKESKTCMCCAFYHSILQLSPFTSVLFPSLQHAFETDFQGWPHCSFLILTFFPAHRKVCCLTPANVQQALMWNCTDLGQRLISLSLLTNPGLRVCVLLAGRHLWFNTTPPDMTSNHRQRLCDTVHLYFHLFILQQPINHTWTIRQPKRDGQNLETIKREAISWNGMFD